MLCGGWRAVRRQIAALPLQILLMNRAGVWGRLTDSFQEIRIMRDKRDKRDKREDPINYHLVLASGLLLVIAGEQWLGSLELTVLGTAVMCLGMVSRHSLSRARLPRL